MRFEKFPVNSQRNVKGFNTNKLFSKHDGTISRFVIDSKGTRKNIYPTAKTNKSRFLKDRGTLTVTSPQKVLISGKPPSDGCSSSLVMLQDELVQFSDIYGYISIFKEQNLASFLATRSDQKIFRINFYSSKCCHYIHFK